MRATPWAGPLAAAVVVLAAAFVGLTSARADVFIVRDVDVDVTADNAAAARDEAVLTGQVEAARRLLDRLTLPEDRLLVPALDAASATPLVAGFEVQREQASSRRYIATLSVAFDPAAVRGYLRGYGAPFVESQTRAMVVIPVMQGPAGPVLWETNPWFDAWATRDFSNELVPLIAPFGDISDIAGVDAGQALRFDGARLSVLAQRYGVERVVVAVARGGGPAGGGARAEVTLVDFAEGGARTGYGAVDAFDLPSLTVAVSDRLSNVWKRRTVVRSQVVSEIQLSTLFDGPREWTVIQQALGAAALVDDARLDAFTMDGALMQVAHRGDPSQLTAELAERGVLLVYGQDGVWRAAAGPAAQARAQALASGRTAADVARDPAFAPQAGAPGAASDAFDPYAASIGATEEPAADPFGRDRFRGETWADDG